MSAASLRSDADIASRLLQSIRVSGGLSLAFESRDGVTRVACVSEADGYRARFPDCRPHCEAILLNTGGGVAGGDKVGVSCDLGPRADVVITTVSAERIYRASGAASEVDITVSLADSARLAWLPQETILYSQSRLTRRVTIELAANAELTFLDILVLGRRGSGERMGAGHVADCWTVRRGGRLIHLEALRLDGVIEDQLARAAVTDGANVVATLLHVSPRAEERLERVRAAIAGSTASLQDSSAVPDSAASAWGGKLVVRAVGHKLDAVRAVLAAACQHLTGVAMPRSWGL